MMKLPFSTDPKFWVYQFAALIMGLMCIFSQIPKKSVMQIVDILSSLRVPPDWSIGMWIFGILCLFYTIGGK